jgi:hypothetical protein
MAARPYPGRLNPKGVTLSNTYTGRGVSPVRVNRDRTTASTHGPTAPKPIIQRSRDVTATP